MSLREKVNTHQKAIKLVLGGLASIAVAFGLYEEEHINSILALIYSIVPLVLELIDIA